MESQTEDFDHIGKNLRRNKTNNKALNINRINRTSQLWDVIKSLSCRNTRDNFKVAENFTKVSQKTLKIESIHPASNKLTKINSNVSLLSELLKPSQFYETQTFRQLDRQSIKLKPLSKKSAKRPKRILKIMPD